MIRNLKKTTHYIVTLLCLLVCGVAYSSSACSVQIDSPIEARNLGVVINLADKNSVEIGDYYVKNRHIPAQNIIYIKFAGNKPTLSRKEFALIKAQVDKATPAHVQAYALAWTQPFRVDCMSMTSAFAFGFSDSFCAQGCKATQQNAYYNSASHRPWDAHRVRPAMLLAGSTLAAAKKTIDSGIASDASYPLAAAYFLSTSDVARNTRKPLYDRAKQQFGQRFKIELLEADALENKTDVFLYFTGVAQVDGLDTLQFLPGSIGDHLTSHGGNLTSARGQMSSLRWLDAGATASYGTVVEPCNFTQKFPNPVIVMERYLQGDALIEAYWKSVAWPGQGVFVGEPLASPFRMF